MVRPTLEERLANTSKPLLRKLYKIMIAKQSNLCVAVNFETIEEVLRFVDVAAKYIVIIKVQCRRMKGDIEDNLRLLRSKGELYNFLIFLDDKFNDTEETTIAYMRKYIRYVDLVTVLPASPSADEPMMAVQKAFQEAQLGADEPRGCIPVCQMSYSKMLRSDEEIRLSVAESHPMCVGIVAQDLTIKDEFNMVKLTPGVHIGKTTDGMGQNWKHPTQVMASGTDILIVGRGIVAEPADRWEEVTKHYKETGYSAYLDSTKQ